MVPLGLLIDDNIFEAINLLVAKRLQAGVAAEKKLSICRE